MFKWRSSTHPPIPFHISNPGKPRMCSPRCSHRSPNSTGAAHKERGMAKTWSNLQCTSATTDALSTHVCMIYVCTCMCIYIYIYIHADVYVCIYNVYLCIYTYVYIYIHDYTYTCIQLE